MDKMKESERLLSIAAVEREVGLSKDVLRVWERRYGFPVPHRDARGERSYPADQVARLALIKRLMDRGLRPGRLLALPLEELQMLSGSAAEPGDASAVGGEPVQREALLRVVREHDAPGLADALQRRLAKQGLEQFVLDTIAPTALQVGDQWAQGELQIHEEHLYTEVVTRILRQAIAQVPAGETPVVLLTTLPDEPHALGLLMVECLLVLHGARCINLGTQMPVMEIARAAQAHGADVVALSFSSAFPARLAPELVRQLVSALPPQVRVWAGGAGAARLGRLDPAQLQVTASLADVRSMVEQFAPSP